MNGLNARARALVLCLLAVFAGVIVWRLSGWQWPEAIRFSPTAAVSVAASLFAIAAAVLLLYWKARLSVQSAVVVTLALLALASGRIGSLLVVGWLGFSSIALGRLVLRGCFRFENDSLLTELLVGAGFFGTVVGFLAHTPFNNSGVYGLLLAAPLMMRPDVPAGFFRLLATAIKPSEAIPVIDRLLLVSVAGWALVLFYVLVAFLPEWGHDALAMHLFIPSQLAVTGRWAFDVDSYAWAVMPLLGDWLFALTYMLASESGARLTNVFFLFVLVWIVDDLVDWVGGSKLDAAWARLLLVCTPLTFTVGSSLFIETVWAAFLIGGSLMVLRGSFCNERTPADFVVGGLLLGLAASAKAVTLTYLPVLMVLMIWRWKGWIKHMPPRWILVGIVGFTVLACVPYVTAYVITGNPVFPFYNGLFKSDFFPHTNFVDARFSQGVSLTTLYQMTFNTTKYLEAVPGGAGFLWFLLVVPATLSLFIVRQWRALLLLLLGLVAVIVCFQATAYLRYVFPFTLLICAALGVAVGQFSGGGSISARVSMGIVLAVVMANSMFLASGSPYWSFGLHAALSERHGQYLTRQIVPERQSVQIARALNTDRAPVAIFASPFGADIGAPVLYANWYNQRFLGEVLGQSSPKGIASILNARGVQLLIVDAKYDQVSRGVIDKVLAATEPVSTIGSLSVRRLRPEFLFTDELMRDNEVSSRSTWSIPMDVRRTQAGELLVTSASAANQLISVEPSRRYRNEATIRCADQPGQVRLQVRWLDARSQFLSVDSAVFECTTEPKAHSQDLISPVGAVSAEVWATAHTGTPIVFMRGSFRK